MFPNQKVQEGDEDHLNLTLCCYLKMSIVITEDP